MAFNTFIYLLFLAVSVIGYYSLPKRIGWIWLLIASIGYYLTFIPLFIVLIAGLIIINYLLSNIGERVKEEDKNRFLILTILLNILILAFFKYFNILFPGNQVSLVRIAFFHATDPQTKMILPLGLSYIVFTVLSYHIEAQRKTIQPETHLGYFSLYLLFFPKIAQGPIEKPQNLICQLRVRPEFDEKNISEGLKTILWGYFKKLVIADRLAIYVNAVYSNADHHSGITLFVATIFFAFQIYADFSGYTDIALGSARLFGINLTNNFKRPYLAVSLQDFWNRWHISFSVWLRDYIFFPLTYFLRNKLGRVKYLGITTEKWIYLIAIFITFAVCGIWHGVGWTYLTWGMLFGIFLTVSNWTKKLNKTLRKRLGVSKGSGTYQGYQILKTFILVTFAWVFFRAATLSEAGMIINKILSLKGPFYLAEQNTFFYSISGIILLVIIEMKAEFLPGRFLLLNNRNTLIRYSAYVFLIVCVLLFGVLNGGQFIYFQY